MKNKQWNGHGDRNWDGKHDRQRCYQIKNWINLRRKVRGLQTDHEKLDSWSVVRGRCLIAWSRSHHRFRHLTNDQKKKKYRFLKVQKNCILGLYGTIKSKIHRHITCPPGVYSDNPLVLLVFHSDTAVKIAGQMRRRQGNELVVIISIWWWLIGTRYTDTDRNREYLLCNTID